ncbi:hypothetical protein J5X84_32040 [Streptosporangiaceae bacterium NEAU-GS5]|nr:hypothetical protein [Streptosporangiaceae bacterium NEAU-GS5]
MSLGLLITWEEWPRRAFPVDASERVVVKHNGRPRRRVLGPGRHGPLSGVPLLGHLEIVTFSRSVVRHSSTIPQIRLRDGALVQLSVTALVRLAFVDDEELIEWVEEYDIGTLTDEATLRNEFDGRVRRLLADLDYEQVRRHGFEIAPIVEQWATTLAGGFLEIVGVESAVIERDPHSELRREARRSAVLTQIREHAEGLTRLARALPSLYGTGSAMERLRVEGWIAQADCDLDTLHRRARDYGVPVAEIGSYLGPLAACLIKGLVAACPGSETREHRERTRQAILSGCAWELLGHLHADAWGPVLSALRAGDLDSVAEQVIAMAAPALDGRVVNGASIHHSADTKLIELSVAWRLPKDFVKSPRVNAALTSFGVGSLVAGCHTGSASRVGMRCLYVVSTDIPRLLDELGGQEWTILESVGADRMAPLPLTDDLDETVRTWFRVIVGLDATRIGIRANARGGLTVQISPDVSPGDVSPAALNAFAEALIALTGMPTVELAQ